jgi:hypothetical protein
MIRLLLRVDVGDGAWDGEDVLLEVVRFDDLSGVRSTQAVALDGKDEVSVAQSRGSKRNVQEVEVELSEHEEARKRVDSDNPNGVLGLYKKEESSVPASSPKRKDNTPPQQRLQSPSSA